MTLQSDTFHNDLVISTHTLTWSVTINIRYTQIELRYFNSHAHVERDHFSRRKNCKQLHFNSHAHVERDGQCQSQFYEFGISTHTLTWSVTTGVKKAVGTFKNFNSHAHVERDVGKILDLLGSIISTHTLTWSVTHSVETAGVI